MENLDLITNVAFLTMLYIFLGIGTGRAVAKMKGREVWSFECCIWPIVLLAVAFTGDTTSTD